VYFLLEQITLYFNLTFGRYNLPLKMYGIISHFTRLYQEKVYTVLVKPYHIIVVDIWEINAGKNKYFISQKGISGQYSSASLTNDFIM